MYSPNSISKQQIQSWWISLRQLLSRSGTVQQHLRGTRLTSATKQPCTKLAYSDYFIHTLYRTWSSVAVILYTAFTSAARALPKYHSLRKYFSLKPCTSFAVIWSLVVAQVVPTDQRYLHKPRIRWQASQRLDSLRHGLVRCQHKLASTFQLLL